MVVTNNKIYNNSQDGGYFYRGTPKFYSNSIYDNTGNGLYFYSSSGKIGYSSGTNKGLNEICDNGSWGVYANALTEIFMGSSDSEGNRIGGYNAVMGNTINEVCSRDAHVEAEYNYWGTSSPTSALFTLVYGGTIDYVPYLTSDPNGGSNLAKKSSVLALNNPTPNTTNRWEGYNPANLNFNKLSDLWLYGLELTLHNQPEEAIKVYKMLIEKFPESKEAKKAMVKIHHLLRESDKKAQDNYFVKLLPTEANCKKEYRSTAMALAAYTYCDMELPSEAIRLFEELVTEYPDSSTALGSLYSLVTLNLNNFNNAQAASTYLDIMKQKYSSEALTLFARNDMGEEVDWSVLNKKQIPLPKELASKLPTEFKLYNNYPNPFNPTTNIKFDLPEKAHVTVSIYDLKGREVAQLVNQEMNAGVYNIIWDGKDKFGSNLASGFYIYQMRTSSGFIKTNKMILMK
jgi:tetratricopeptide (TPR) repeat protein